LFNGDIEDLPDWVDAIPDGNLPRIYADVGSSDPAVKDAYAFEQALNALGVAHEWHLNSGRHNEDYWAEQLPDYLAWYTLAWLEE
jgi:S-formylglutathione hydrolase FrmB